jgi:hypothetical protein
METLVMSWTVRFISATAAAAVLMPLSVFGQEAIRQDCLAHVAPVSRLAFSHDKHRQWYRRYWNGRCEGLSTSFLGDACSESEPGWNQAVTDILRQGQPQRAAELLAKACKLGELIGYEWAKDNNVRCIHTMGSNSLSSLNAILKERGDILQRLDRIEARAKSMCQSLRSPVVRR